MLKRYSKIEYFGVAAIACLTIIFSAYMFENLFGVVMLSSVFIISPFGIASLVLYGWYVGFKLKGDQKKERILRSVFLVASSLFAVSIIICMWYLELI